jgi:predicted Rossmann fold flavoprotein
LFPRSDVVIVGAGAAGLATAAFTRALCPSRAVVVLDSAKKPGAKILVSGGGRCNVTNARVSERDFWGGRGTVIRRILRGFSVDETVAFFGQLGVALHEEADGKLFPDSNRARDVLDALLGEVERLGAGVRADHRVEDIARRADGFEVATNRGPIAATRVVLATGGCSLPKSGSDGAGLQMARRLGHTIVPPTPALAPLVLDGDPDGLHARLSGVSHHAELTVWIDGRVSIRLAGALLWTHFGISGPVALNVSRHWTRAALDRREEGASGTLDHLGVRMTLNFSPGLRFDDMDERLVRLVEERPRASMPTLLSTFLPGSVATVLIEALGFAPTAAAAQLTRDARRRLAHALVEWPLPVTGTRGYNYAEATAGGVALEEIDPASMESRICRGLYLVGEMLDVDGRIGGFNFQWAWSSARIAARAIARQ